MINLFISKLQWDVYRDEIEKILPTFSPEIMCKYHRFKNGLSAAHFLFGRLILKYSLEFLGIENKLIDNVRYGEFGKPFFANADFDFNISHSGDYVVCAFIQRGTIGVDIEIKKMIDFDDFNTLFTESELKVMSEAQNRSNSFYDFWTRKESVLKALGTGLSTPLNSFEVLSDFVSCNNHHLYLKKPSFEDHGYAIHIASDLDVAISVIETQFYEII